MIIITSIIWGDKYSDAYVNKLFNSIKRNTTLPFQFICYVDSMARTLVPCITKKPIPYFTGDWYSKISLYNVELYNPNDQIFYFDLDTVIINNIDDILSYKGNFALLENFTHPGKYGSGFMSWKPVAVDHMWKNFKPGWKDRFGDQAWCELQYPNADFWQKLYPQKVISYKVHIKKSMRPVPGQTGDLSTASIVCFHGTPNPHEVAEPWVKQHWI